MEREFSDGVIGIRPLCLEDAAAHLAGEDAETVRWLSGGVSDIAGTRSWIERSTRHWRDRGPTFVFGIWESSPRTLVGMIEANTDHRQLDAVAEDGANISYGLHSRARSRGICRAPSQRGKQALAKAPKAPAQVAPLSSRTT